ncbi:cytochrome P450 [Apiospora marii]|uniref:Cytochrome P450 n=1 Tax=Apiospora marii TaxID=335849 RepID=A0ABR1S3N9_9PEZI
MQPWPQDVAVAYRDNVALKFDGHLNDLLQAFGFNADAIRRSWHKPEPGDSCYIPNNPVNPDQLDFIHLTEDIYKKQLLPGPKMNEMCTVFMRALHHSLEWENLGVCTSWVHGSRRQISLYSLCRAVMVDAVVRSMFGGHLHDIEPDIVNHMLGFNDNAWMVFFRYPDFFGLPVTGPRNKIMSALRTFVQLPEDERSEQSWAVQNIIAAQNIVGIDLQAQASVLLLILWAANSNEYNISFWVLAHLLFDESLKDLVRQETEAAWHTGQLDIKYLCANCPNLEAIFNETLRLNGGAMVSRVVLHETNVGGKVLRAGNTILIPSRQLHTNEDVWGGNVRTFQWDRFLQKKSLVRHSSFRPFGGGQTFCPGRVLAKEEVYGFVAILLHQYDLKLVRRPGAGDGLPDFPRLNDATPALGITGPLWSDDLAVEMNRIER